MKHKKLLNKLNKRKSENQRLKKRLKQSQALNRIYAMWAHEMRSPLLALQSSLDQMETVENHQAWWMAKQAVTLMEQGLNDLLNVGQIEADRLVIQSQTFSLEELCQELDAFANTLLKDKSVEWRRQEQNSDVLLQGDPYRLKQVLVNLISNAIKFTRHGYVSLLIQRQEEGWCFSVEDTGEGMDSEKMDQLFQPYTQFLQNSSQTQAGSGLGLSIVKYMVDAMGGQIHVESEKAKGSRFEVCLPLVQAQTENSNPDQTMQDVSSIATDSGALNILIADDSELSRRVFRDLFSDQNVLVVEAENGQQALDQLNSQEFDYVFLDYFMPEQDGESVCRQLRAMQMRGQQSALKMVVLVSAEPVKASDLNPCFDLTLIKPISQKALFKLMNLPLNRVYKKFKKSGCKKIIHGKMPNELTHLLPKFIREVSQHLSDIEQAVATQDNVDFHAITHQLKGSFMLFQLSEMAEQVDLLNGYIADHQTDEVMRLLSELREQVQALSECAE